MSSVWQTVRKFLHKDDGYLYTTQGVLIPIKASSLTEDSDIDLGGLKVADLEGMIYYAGGQ
jgi:hypothetical protein